MAHKCVKCGRVYDSQDEHILKGCVCGSKLFIFIPDEKLSEKDKEILKKTKEELKEKNNVDLKKDVIEEIDISNVKVEKLRKNKKDRKEDEIEKEIKRLFNIKEEDVLVLPLEAVQILGEGKFLIDVNKLFQEKVVVIKTREGSYILQLY